MLSRDSEDEMWSRFVFELVIWPQEVTLVRWTQPSGPLCLWQCFICCLTICLIKLIFFQPWSVETVTRSDNVNDIDNGSEVDLIITNSRFYESQLIFFQPWSEEAVTRSDPSEEKEGSCLVHGKPSSIKPKKKSKQPKKTYKQIDTQNKWYERTSSMGNPQKSNQQTNKKKDDKEPPRKKKQRLKFFQQACIPVSSAPPAPTALLRKVNYSLILQSFYSYFSWALNKFQVQSESNLLKIKTRRGKDHSHINGGL